MELLVEVGDDELRGLFAWHVQRDVGVIDGLENRGKKLQSQMPKASVTCSKRVGRRSFQAFPEFPGQFPSVRSATLRLAGSWV